MDDRLTQLSKTLAYVLRHRPESIGIDLDSAGWVELSTLVPAMVAAGHVIAKSDIDQILLEGDKQRYEVFGGRIRAAQGHSVNIDLGLKPERPPRVLFHGTVESNVEQILRQGLRPGRRSHVHLSAEEATARSVGQRRGTPIVLCVEAERMHSQGHVFLQASNGVWLVDHVTAMFVA